MEHAVGLNHENKLHMKREPNLESNCSLLSGRLLDYFGLYSVLEESREARNCRFVQKRQMCLQIIHLNAAPASGYD